MKNNISVFVITAIMVSGLLLGSMGTVVFADVDPATNPGQARGCAAEYARDAWRGWGRWHSTDPTGWKWRHWRRDRAGARPFT